MGPQEYADQAEVPGRAAVFSIQLVERALRELWHEAGHLRGLAHCADWSRVMRSSHSVERVDAGSARGGCGRRG